MLKPLGVLATTGLKIAGILGHDTAQKGILERGDLEEALNAARQIGDDTIQRRTQGYIVPESFSHGTSAQRRDWTQGLDAGTGSGAVLNRAAWKPATRSTTPSDLVAIWLRRGGFRSKKCSLPSIGRGRISASAITGG